MSDDTEGRAPQRHHLFDTPAEPGWRADLDVAHRVLDPSGRSDTEASAASSSKGEQPSRWNYRVVQSADATEYFIAEVYYDGDALSWVDPMGDCLRWDRLDHLKRTVELMQQAFDRPLLRATGDGRVVEVPPT